MKKYSFYFHYNKPLSRKHNKNILTLHYGGACHFVTDIECNVPTKIRHRRTQPKCVIAGKGIIEIKNGKARID